MTLLSKLRRIQSCLIFFDSQFLFYSYYIIVQQSTPCNLNQLTTPTFKAINEINLNNQNHYSIILYPFCRSLYNTFYLDVESFNFLIISFT